MFPFSRNLPSDTIGPECRNGAPEISIQPTPVARQQSRTESRCRHARPPKILLHPHRLSHHLTCSIPCHAGNATDRHLGPHTERSYSQRRACDRSKSCSASCHRSHINHRTHSGRLCCRGGCQLSRCPLGDVRHHNHHHNHDHRLAEVVARLRHQRWLGTANNVTTHCCNGWGHRCITG